MCEDGDGPRRKQQTTNDRAISRTIATKSNKTDLVDAAVCVERQQRRDVIHNRLELVRFPLNRVYVRKLNKT